MIQTETRWCRMLYITINKLCVIELYKSIHIIRSTYVYLLRVFFVISIEHAFYSILQFSCARRRYKITILHHCSVSLSPCATFSFFPIGLHNYLHIKHTIILLVLPLYR